MEDKGKSLQDIGKDQFVKIATNYFVALEERDFSVFQKFLNADLEFTAVLPGVRIINDVSEFLKSQEHWFNGTTGTFEAKVLRGEYSPEIGALYVLASYQNFDLNGKEFHWEIYISALFRRVESKWFLIHTQNTVSRIIK